MTAAEQNKIKLAKDHQVGKWKVAAKLGEGAFGAVYLVERLGAKVC